MKEKLVEMIDVHGLQRVLEVIVEICEEKGEMLLEEDVRFAYEWPWISRKIASASRIVPTRIRK